MNLPEENTCKADPFLWMLRGEDQEGFFADNRSKNKAFLVRRRFNYSVELFNKYLLKNKGNLKVADFACGTGNVGIMLHEMGHDVTFVDNEKFDAIFFGEAIEHMAEPDKTIKNLWDNLKTGGILCLTTPNGDFVDCYEPNWNSVKDQKERNSKLANTIGNHVCEFTFNEMKELLKLNGFNIIHHESFLSKQISKHSILRRLLPESMLGSLDQFYSKKMDSNKKNYGRTQIVIAQRAH